MYPKTLEIFVEDVGPFVFKVLGGDEGVEEVYAVLPLKATISPPTLELMSKAYGGWTEHRPDIEDTDVRLENGPKGVEEPAVVIFFGSSP